jgi:two-component system, OmpR family, KDP operon response regulator KdpE
MNVQVMAKILIVDDQPRFRRVLQLALEVKGYEIQEAGSGSEAMELLQANRPDLVLLDWQMPGSDGICVCGAIRAISEVPIIMVTSKQDGRSQALAAGADDYITKPFGFDDLAALIESALTK